MTSLVNVLKDGLYVVCFMVLTLQLLGSLVTQASQLNIHLNIIKLIVGLMEGHQHSVEASWEL